jgi:MoxR-like ATPase
MNIERQLSLVPLQTLDAVLLQHGIAFNGSKDDAVATVKQLIVDGKTSVAEVKATKASATHTLLNTPHIQAGVNADQLNAFNINLSNAIKSIEGEISRLRGDVATDLASVTDIANDARRKIESVKPPAVDESRIATQIQNEVSKLFDSFRTEVPRERIEEIAQSVPKFDLKSARDVFGESFTKYSGVDFGDLEVGVWSDPDAPEVIDDYIFSPEHLHQTLVALDDPLPDNIWLAGERGTGKTEFVTQVAARLGRRLYRINFDEALERADFIGGNTIENGNVVWKPGIVVQAIQHPGAIVLFDELGFARAQALATLHALCERSHNRSITISETGQRFRVAPHVVFFAADNSNGHGDHSGNFAGVREQNTAFIDRFSFTIRFDYLRPDDEADLIVTRTGITRDAADIIVKLAGVAREKARAGLLTQPPSLRQLFAFARAVRKGVPVETAYRNAVINKFPADCESELLGVFTATCNVNEFKLAIGG